MLGLNLRIEKMGTQEIVSSIERQLSANLPPVKDTNIAKVAVRQDKEYRRQVFEKFMQQKAILIEDDKKAALVIVGDTKWVIFNTIETAVNDAISRLLARTDNKNMITILTNDGFLTAIKLSELHGMRYE